MSDWNFAAVWDGIAQIVPDRDAVVCGDRRISWGVFSARATRLAWYLKTEAGAEPGDRVAIELTNRPEYLETFYAALKLGCVPVNVNFRYTANELHYLFDNSDAKAVVHGPEFTKAVKVAAKRVPKPWRPRRLEAGEPYERALAGAPPAGEWIPRPPSGDDLIFLYTGGTTGMPKRVLLERLSAATLVDSLGASEGIGPRNAVRADDASTASARFSVNDRVRVINEDTGHDVVPGSGEVGLVAMGGRIPLGYFKDPE